MTRTSDDYAMGNQGVSKITARDIDERSQDHKDAVAKFFYWYEGKEC